MEFTILKRGLLYFRSSVMFLAMCSTARNVSQLFSISKTKKHVDHHSLNQGKHTGVTFRLCSSLGPELIDEVSSSSD